MLVWIRSHWKVLAGVGVGVLLVAGGLFTVISRRQALQAIEEAANLRIALVQEGTLTVTVNATGRLEAGEESELSFLVPGDVAQINIDEGDRVQAGDVLMSLNTTTLELSLSEAELAHDLQVLSLGELIAGPSEAQLAVAKAGVSQAGSQLAQITRPPTEYEQRIAELGLELARNQRYHDQNARGTFAITKGPGVDKAAAEQRVLARELGVDEAKLQIEQLDQGASAGAVASASAQVAAAQARLDALREGPGEIDLAIAEKQIELAGLSIDLARITLEDAQIRAPFDAVVSEVSATQGEVVTRGVPVMRVIDNTAFHLDVDVDEVDIARLDNGQRVRIAVDALPDERITGKVERIAPTATTVNGVVSYNVRVALDATSAPLRAGMTATAAIVVDRVDDALLVPNWAVRIDRETGEALVNVRDEEGNIEEVIIEIGLRSDSFSEVLMGLQAETMVVVNQQREDVSFFGGGQ